MCPSRTGDRRRDRQYWHLSRGGTGQGTSSKYGRPALPCKKGASLCAEFEMKSMKHVRQRGSWKTTSSRKGPRSCFPICTAPMADMKHEMNAYTGASHISSQGQDAREQEALRARCEMRESYPGTRTTSATTSPAPCRGAHALCKPRRRTGRRRAACAAHSQSGRAGARGCSSTRRRRHHHTRGSGAAG